jgi:hypothetical protein
MGSPMKRGGGVAMTVVRARVVAGSWLVLAAACGERDQPPPTAALEPVTAEGGGLACGRPPLPPCPLQDWMDANLAPSFAQGRLDGLVLPLETLAAGAPADYGDWAPLARRGAQAARNGDADNVRASCGACHHAYRERFRAERRGRHLPEAMAAAR